MSLPIEARDCMARAVASVLEKPELIEPLRIVRDQQQQVESEKLDLQEELANLYALFHAIGASVTVQLATVRQISELDALLDNGEKVLIGLSQGQNSSPHIVHVSEKYSQPQIIEGDHAQLAWKGYRSNQQYLSTNELLIALMEQGYLQLFLIK